MINRTLPEERIVAYIDILGFKKLVEEMNKNYYKYSSTLKALNDAEEILSSYKNRNRYNKDNQELNRLYQSIEATLLSDSIVITCPLTDNNQITISRIIHYIQYLAIYFMREGLYVRGCVTIGWCYHKDNIIFGNGLNKAIGIEKEKAKYPRIIITDDVISSIDKSKEPSFYYKRDKDGYWIIDVIRYYLEESLLPDELNEKQTEEVINISIDNMKTNIFKSLKRLKIDDGDVKLKYLWLIEQFNDSIDQVEKMHKINTLNKYKITSQT